MKRTKRIVVDTDVDFQREIEEVQKEMYGPVARNEILNDPVAVEHATQTTLRVIRRRLERELKLEHNA